MDIDPLVKRSHSSSEIVHIGTGDGFTRLYTKDMHSDREIPAVLKPGYIFMMNNVPVTQRRHHGVGPVAEVEVEYQDDVLCFRFICNEDETLVPVTNFEASGEVTLT